MKKQNLYLRFLALNLWKRVAIVSSSVVAVAIVSFIAIRAGKNPFASAVVRISGDKYAVIISEKSVPRYTVDSLLFASARDNYNRAADQYTLTLKYYGPDSVSRARCDSLFRIADSLQTVFKRLRAFPTEQTTLCRYTSDGDTLTAIFDDRKNVIYPR